MAKESLYNPDSRVIFRETFNSLEDIVKNRGTITDIILNNGVASFNGSTSKIVYDKNLSLSSNIFRKSIRIIFTPTEFIADTGLIDIGPGTLGIYEQNISGGFGVLVSAAVRYINGSIGTSFILNKKNDIVVTGYNTSSLTRINIGFRNGFGYFKGTMELVEIYNGTLTATEVSELYKGTLYKTLKDSSEIFHINAYQGVINDLITRDRAITYSGGLPRVRDVIGTRNVMEISSVMLLPINPSINVFSMSLWVKRYSVGYTTNSFLIRGEGGVAKTYLLSGGSTSLIWQGSTSGSVTATGIDFTKNLIHVIVTYNNGAVQFYINGVANASGNVVGGIINTSIGPSNTFGAPAYNSFVNFRMFNNKLLTLVDATRIFWSEKVLFKIPS